MELEPVLELLRTCARHNQGDREINVLSESWYPFGKGLTNQHREIRLLNTLPLGRGTFGIVYAGLMRVTLCADFVRQQTAAPLYVPVAIKMAVIVRDHLCEAVNGLAINELMQAGCTPGLTQTFDAFCINTVLDEVAMPPRSWKDFWEAYDRFVFVKADEIKRHYGDASLRDSGNEEKQTARLANASTLGFLLTELSPYDLTTSLKQGRTRPLPSLLQDPIDTAGILKRIYAMFQTLSAVHAAGMLHMDIHSGNFIRSLPQTHRFDFRCFNLPLIDPEASEIRNQLYGKIYERAQLRSQGSYAYLQAALHTDTRPLQDSSLDARDNVVVVDTPDIDLLIDLGSMRNARVVYGMAPTAVQSYLHVYFFERYPEITVADVPAYGFSHHPPQFVMGSSSPYALPLMMGFHSPVTNITTRAPEQANPFVIQRNDKTYAMGVMSELGDVASLMAVALKLIIGFDPFGRVLPVTMIANRTLDQPDYTTMPYRVGLFVPPNNIKRFSKQTQYQMTSTFGSVLLECHGEAGRGSGDNFDLRLKSSDNNDYDRYKQHEFYSDDSHVKWAILVNPRTSHVSPGYVHGSTGDGSGAVLSTMSLHERVDAFIRKSSSQFVNFTQWIFQKDGKMVNKQELEDVVTGLVARIEALGVPPPDQCTGTLLYPLFREIENVYGANRVRTGWLNDVLYSALTVRLGLPPPQAAEFLWLCMDALAWDPAFRPPAHRVLRCCVFDLIYKQPAQLGNLDPRTYWSSTMPNAYYWPPQAPDVTQINWGDLSRYLATPRTERSLVSDFMIMCRPVKLYQKFLADFASVTGFMMAQQRAHHTPLLHANESRQVAACNFNTGLLDYYDGTRCFDAQYDVVSMVRSPEMRAHFNSRENLQQFCLTLLAVTGKFKLSYPNWLLYDDDSYSNQAAVSLREYYRLAQERFEKYGQVAPFMIESTTTAGTKEEGEVSDDAPRDNNKKRKERKEEEEEEKEKPNKKPKLGPSLPKTNHTVDSYHPLQTLNGHTTSSSASLDLQRSPAPMLSTDKTPSFKSMAASNGHTNRAIMIQRMREKEKERK